MALIRAVTLGTHFFMQAVEAGGRDFVACHFERSTLRLSAGEIGPHFTDCSFKACALSGDGWPPAIRALFESNCEADISMLDAPMPHKPH